MCGRAAMFFLLPAVPFVWYTGMMNASFILSLLLWLSDSLFKSVLIFPFAWLHCDEALNSVEQKAGRIVWEFKHPSPAHTPQLFITATAPNLWNENRDIRMGVADARCILKIVLSLIGSSPRDAILSCIMHICKYGMRKWITWKGTCGSELKDIRNRRNEAN